MRNRVTHRWIPQFHEAQLTKLNKEGHDDLTIARLMGFMQSTISSHRTELGLPINPKIINNNYREVEGPKPVEKVDPLGVAYRFLPGFDRETMTLNGKPINLDDAMRRTNRLLKGWGMEQVGHNPRWLV